jgi:hypothetical protein
MSDVNVSVVVDGKTVFCAGAVGAPDPCAAISAHLGIAVAHFQAVAGAVAASVKAQADEKAQAQATIIKAQADMAAASQAAKPQDTSL